MGPRVHAGPSGRADGGGVAVGRAPSGNAVRVGVAVGGGGEVWGRGELNSFQLLVKMF